MNVTYRIEGLEFEWDEDKAEKTLKSMAFALKRLLRLSSTPFIKSAMRRGKVKSAALSWVTR